METSEDCCKSGSTDTKDCCSSKPKEKKNLMNYVLAGAVVLVLVVAAVQLFQMNKIKNEITGNAVANAANGAVDTSGWTETEKMEYEHHGTLPQRLQRAQGSNGPAAMVGGC